jgi:hypothetical protein
MSPDLQCVSVIQTIRAQHTYVSPPCGETVLGPAGLKERGDRRRPRYALTNSLFFRPQSENDDAVSRRLRQLGDWDLRNYFRQPS